MSRARHVPSLPTRSPVMGPLVLPAWQRVHLHRIAVGDLLCVLTAAAVTHVLSGAAWSWADLLLPAAWVLSLLMTRSYEQLALGVGPQEVARVLLAAVLSLATVSTASWLTGLQPGRDDVVVTLVLAALGALAQRHAWGRWLDRERRRGRFLQRTLLVGHRSGVATLQARLDQRTGHGYQVIGCCLPSDAWTDERSFNGLPVLGDLGEVPDVVRRYQVRTVAVLPSPELDGAALRRLGWELEGSEVELLLSPAVAEFVGPRLWARPVWRLPLVRMERPGLHGVQAVIKEVTDRTLAALVVLLALPVLAGLAAMLKGTQRGPVLVRELHVGRDGRVFELLRFRTAERAGSGRPPGVLQALLRSPLRELPQLFNVLAGDLSLVGPRPRMLTEWEHLDPEVRRALLVKPGLTGLRLLDGPKAPPWGDSGRLVLTYVENWSPVLDLVVLWRSAVATLRRPVSC